MLKTKKCKSIKVILLLIPLEEEFNRIYDANGNLISDGKYYREYNGLNQLIKVRLGNTSTSPVAEEYVWHPIEERIVVKRVFYNGVYNYTVYYPTKEFVRIVNSSGTFDEKYVYQDGVLVAQIDTDGNKQFIHSDHEGSNTLITDINGNVLENTFYSPYGEIIEGGKKSRFDYEGKEFDSLTEDYDFGFRKIDPKVPIWDKPDTLIQNVYDPQSLNRYMVERGNPYKHIDPTGHEPIKKEAGKYKNDKKDNGKDVSLQIGKIIAKLKTQASKSGKTLTSKEIYKALTDYYNGDYKKDGVPRYVYTTKNGWIDLLHYFKAAYEVQDRSKFSTTLLGYGVEVYQTGSYAGGSREGTKLDSGYTASQSGNQLDSAFSFEDLPSNAAGIDQGYSTRGFSADKTKDSLDQNFQNMDATSPTSDPKYNNLNEEYSSSASDRSVKVPWLFPTKIPDWLR